MDRALPIKVLVAHAYYLRYDEKQYRKMKPYPPLATLITASVLRNEGYSVHLFDAMVASGVEQFDKCLDEIRPSIVAVVEDNFNFLTKMCTVRMREAALHMIRSAKRFGCRVAVNGSDATDHDDLYLEAGADAVVVGEPEETVAALLRAWTDAHDRPMDDIPGLVLPGETPSEGVARTPSRPFLTELDALPFPAWDLVDVERYRSLWREAHGRFSWNVVASRGCPYKCNWCAKPVFGTRYAQRSPANVAEEFHRLRREVAPDHVWLADDIFGLTSAWIESFGREIVARDAQIPFMMQSRANLMTTSSVAALTHAGAEEVWLGAESGSQSILDAMDKGTTVGQIRTATRTLKAAGIRACWFIQLGYLGEQWEQIIQTRDLIRDERPDDIGVSVSYPLPGTKFFAMVKQQLGPKTNWDSSDDLDMMFHGTYTTPFYRVVRDLLHDEVTYGNAENVTARQELEQRWVTLAHEEAQHRSPAAATSPS